MSSIECFEINLEHDIDEQYQYEPGEMLRGNITLRLRDAVKIKGVVLQVKGEATVSWEEPGEGRAIQADEMYIDKTMQLLQPGPEDASITLAAGEQRYPFEIPLPDNLPSSFIGKFGSITYVLKATLKEDNRFSLGSMITSEPFLVLRRLDISNDESLRKPVERKASKRLFGAIAFCRSGKVTLELKVNWAGHLPGEDIIMDAEVTNGSPRSVEAVQASILMHSTYHARHKSCSNTQVVNKKRENWEIGYGESNTWKNIHLTIPPYIPESRLDSCDIIDTSYELLFRVEIEGGHEVSIKLPIVVGTTIGGAGGTRRRAGGGGTTSSANDSNKTGEGNNGHLQVEDVGFGLETNEQALKFRRPMDPGETRENPLFDTEQLQDLND